jgi:hypothetical protein
VQQQQQKKILLLLLLIVLQTLCLFDSLIPISFLRFFLGLVFSPITSFRVSAAGVAVESFFFFFFVLSLLFFLSFSPWDNEVFAVSISRCDRRRRRNPWHKRRRSRRRTREEEDRDSSGTDREAFQSVARDLSISSHRGFVACEVQLRAARAEFSSGWTCAVQVAESNADAEPNQCELWLLVGSVSQRTLPRSLEFHPHRQAP